MAGKKAFKNKLLVCLCALVLVVFSVPCVVYASDFEFGTRYDLFSQTVTTPDLYIPDDTTIYTVSVPFTIPVYPSTSNSYRFRMEIWASQSCNNDFVSYWDEYRLSYGGMVYYPTVVNENTIVFDFLFDGGGHNTFTLFCDLHFNGNNKLPERREEWVFNSTVALDSYYYLFDLGFKSTGVTTEISGKVDTIIGQNQQEIGQQEIGNQLQEEANAMQSQEIELQEEANEIGETLLEEVTEFQDNFFSRLGDFLLGIIVPSADELTAFLDEVNAWFGERLGFIWYPFSFAVDMVTALANGEADTGFPVPEFKLNILGTEYQIWGGMTVDLDAFGIFKYVRIFTSFLLVSGIVKLAVNKWDEWIGGRQVG